MGCYGRRVRGRCLGERRTVGVEGLARPEIGGDGVCPQGCTLLAGGDRTEVADARFEGGAGIGGACRLGLDAGANAIELDGRDMDGASVGKIQLNVQCNATPPSPVGNIVINELHFRPNATRAEFVELRNLSATADFDLGGMRLDGVGHRFAPGTILPRNGYLVAAQDEAAWIEAYGPLGALTLAGDYPGRLDGSGETITLIAKDGSTVIDRAIYKGEAPWPRESWDGKGWSLQLLDPTRDRLALWN